MKRSHILISLLFALSVIVLIPIAYPQIVTQRTIRQILNDVYDATNNQLMGTPWAGAQGTAQSETEIFNKVYDPDTHSLRISGGTGGGGGGTTTQVGDCTAPSCLDGSATGGTQISLRKGSFKTTFSLDTLTADRSVTFGDGSGRVVFDNRVLTINGTTNEVNVTPNSQDLSADRTWTASIAPNFDISAKTFKPPQGSALPGTCVVGNVFLLTSAAAGRNWYACTATNTWTLLGDGSATPLVAPLTDNATVTVNSDTCDYCFLSSLSQNSQFANPTGSPGNKKALIIEVVSTTSRTLTWDTKYLANSGIPLPTATTGGSKTDVFGFRYDTTADKWNIVASTQTPKGAITKSVSIVLGADNGSALVNADICPQLQQAFIAYAGTVTEINVSADAGTPSLIVHRRNNAGTVTDLLSSALATGASGAFACAKTSAVAGYTSGVTCSATLQNTTLTAGDWIGFTSGGCAASTAKRLSVTVLYELQ